MVKFSLITVLIASYFSCFSQSTIQLSKVPGHLVLTCDSVVNDFLETYNKDGDIIPYLTPNEANFGGQVWLPVKDFVSFMNQVLPKPNKSFEFEFYTIDDILKNEKLIGLATDLGKILNNYTVLADGAINDREVSIILRKEDESMKIYSITIWDIPLRMGNTKKIIPEDTIAPLNIALKIPDSFGEPTYDQNFISYEKQGETERDETIQIVNSTKQADLSFMTYNWVQHITSNYKRSDFDIGFVPNGIIYRYELLDEKERINKGITIGIEHENQIIFIQYFGFKVAYEKHWKEIDQFTRNIYKL